MKTQSRSTRGTNKRGRHESASHAFIMLSPVERWALHKYYEFTKHPTDSEFLICRSVITQAQPALPRRVGKALAALAVFTDQLETYRQTPHPNTCKKGSLHEI